MKKTINYTIAMILSGFISCIENGEEVFTYGYQGEGVYAVDFRGVIGKEYTIQILLPRIPEYPTFSGKLIRCKSEKLESVSKITNIYSKFKSKSMFHQERYHVFFSTL